MTQALITEQQAHQTNFTRDQIELIKRTICVGATDDELQLFTMQSQRMGLDPFARQIHAVKRKVWNPDTREMEDRMTIQVGIDGYRLVADRTGRYAPGRENRYEYDTTSVLVSATAFVMKMVGGQWMECAATAHLSEYQQTTKAGEPTKMWKEKPHIMLGKCAEALALRRAFPAELSGVYTDDEMAQADTVVEPVRIPVPVVVEDTSWKDELKRLGIEASELMRIATPEVATNISAALDTARDVLRRNGSTSLAERTAAKSALKRLIAEAETKSLDPQPAA